jgi:putative ABC transport system permease protein
VIGAAMGMALATVIPPIALPPEFPVRADAGVWGFAAVATVGLALAVGLPPAIHAMRIKIVDALAGR